MSESVHHLNKIKELLLEQSGLIKQCQALDI